MRIEFEGPRIALYTKKPRFLYENNFILADIVNNVKKRVVVRTEKEVRKDESVTKGIIVSKLPPEAKVVGYFFDDSVGEVIVEVENPHVINKEVGFDYVSIIESTGWKPKIKRAPHIPSSSLQTIYYTLKTGAEDRERFLRESGEKIFRSKISNTSEVSIYTFGAFKEVGRSSLLVSTPESKILVDCGINPGAKDPWDAYPRLDWLDLDLDEIDAVVISHAHMDHQGFLPVLFKYGYDGPVYCTEPTLPLMVLLQMDYVKVASMEGGRALYAPRGLRAHIQRCNPL
ncbi:MAG: MBL fold metallo-hydrolase, partial [Nitrososphaerota archaeon]